MNKDNSQIEYENLPFWKMFLENNEKILNKSKNNLLILVSGGSDSMSILHAYHLLSKNKTFDLKLSVLHINYKLRNEDSDLDEECVINYTKNNNIKLYKCIERIDDRFNLQDEARNIRYKKAIEIAFENNIEFIVSAHNSNDQIETMFWRFLRGSSVTTLEGMKKKQKLNDSVFLIRPLLDISKDEIIHFLKICNVKFRNDKTNFQNKYARNYIRNTIIPSCKTIYEDLEKRLLITNQNIQNKNSVCKKLFERLFNLKTIYESYIVLSENEYSWLDYDIWIEFLNSYIKPLLKWNDISFKSWNSIIDEILTLTNPINLNNNNKIKKHISQFIIRRDNLNIFYDKTKKLIFYNDSIIEKKNKINIEFVDKQPFLKDRYFKIVFNEINYKNNNKSDINSFSFQLENPYKIEDIYLSKLDRKDKIKIENDKHKYVYKYHSDLNILKPFRELTRALKIDKKIIAVVFFNENKQAIIRVDKEFWITDIEHSIKFQSEISF